MENVHDRCISRQLWCRTPAFYHDDCGEMTVSKTDVCTCSKWGGSKNIHQEEHVPDTRFSQRPFSTLAGLDKTKELDYFYSDLYACYRLRHHLLSGLPA